MGHGKVWVCRNGSLQTGLRTYTERRSGLAVPEAMALATATAEGRPSVRMVLLKGADERGFAFHTNYESRKGVELTANPHAALLFHWQPLGRQVRVEGGVERVEAEESVAYFRTRPLGSRLAAWASPQSRPLADRAELERLYAEAQARFGEERGVRVRCQLDALPALVVRVEGEAALVRALQEHHPHRRPALGCRGREGHCLGDGAAAAACVLESALELA